MNPIEKDMMRRMIVWTFIGIGLSWGINFIMFAFFGDAAFPWNLILIIAIFLALGWAYGRRQLKKLGATGGYGNPFTGSNTLHYDCIKCGTTFKGNYCPKCGNRGGRAVFK
jgi:hypothetical protein